MDALRRLAGTFSWLRVVFTYGAVCEDESTNRRKKLDDDCDGRTQTIDRVNYDGLISSIQMFILLTASSSALVLAAKKLETANKVVLALLMSVGMGVILVFFHYKSKMVAPENRVVTDTDGGLGRRNRNGRIDGEGEVGELAGVEEEVGERAGRIGGGWREGGVGGGGGGGRRRKEEAGRESGRGEGRGREEGNRDGEERSGIELGGTGSGGGTRGGGGGGGASSRVVVIGLSVFYICGSLLDLLQIVAGTSCSVMLLRKCHESSAIFRLVVHFIFHLLRVIYLGVVTVFCLRFYLHNLLSRSLVRYTLMFLQAVNLSLWLDATAHRRTTDDSKRSWPFSGDQHDCLRPANATNATDCRKSRFYVTVIEDLSPLVRPFTIQFTLLVANFFCQWFFNCVRVNNSASEHSDGSSSEETSSSANRRRIDNLLKENDRVVTSQNVEPEDRDKTDSGEPDEKTPLVRGATQRAPAARSVGFQLWLVAIIILNSLLVVFSFPVTRKSYLPYGLLFYWISMSLAIGVGFHISRRFTVRWEAQEFTGLDYLLLFTSTGPIAYCAFTLIAIINAGRGVGNGLYFSVFFVVFDLIQSYVQVVFSLYAGRVVPAAAAGDESQARNAAYFRGIVFFLAVSNGVVWIVNTLHDIAGDQKIQTKLYGHDMWIVIYNIMKPLALFFRFNSCLLFIRVFRRRRTNNGTQPERKSRDS